MVTLESGYSLTRILKNLRISSLQVYCIFRSSKSLVKRKEKAMDSHAKEGASKAPLVYDVDGEESNRRLAVALDNSYHSGQLENQSSMSTIMRASESGQPIDVALHEPMTFPFLDWETSSEFVRREARNGTSDSFCASHTSESYEDNESSYGDNHSTCDLQDGRLMREGRYKERANTNWSVIACAAMDRNSRVASNEPLLGGFALLRAVQLLNFDIYYVNKGTASCTPEPVSKKLTDNANDLEQANQHLGVCRSINLTPIGNGSYIPASVAAKSREYRTILDELVEFNPLQKYVDKWFLLNALCQMLKICLSLFAIVLSFSKLISTIVLSVMSKIDLLQGETFRRKTESSDSGSMAVLVLLLINLSSMYILCSTIFNGHLLWNLLSQRLFLVSRRFQYRTMMLLLLFVYCEYFVNLSMINNLYDFSFGPEETSVLDGGTEVSKPTLPKVGSYYTMINLRAFVTDHHETNRTLDMLLTIFQFLRGIIRISPYITINYAIICLKEHIYTIRNQQLLTDSLKRRQKLRLVVVNKNRASQSSKQIKSNGTAKKKRVIFVTDSSDQQQQQQGDQKSRFIDNIENQPQQSGDQYTRNLIEGLRDSTKVSTVNILNPITELNTNNINTNRQLIRQTSITQTRANGSANSNTSDSYVVKQTATPTPILNKGISFLDRINDFDELESYITNLYIFTGRLNRLMSQQGLTIFFIVHNLTISTSLIIPEAIKGGMVMSYVVRILLMFMGILPFVFGQTLNSQLSQLSKQIDRIIIQQQFISRRRDNLVRIRELLHDIRVNCGGMLNFNIETGIKYLVIALASAFFIEQEDYKLTRRQ